MLLINLFFYHQSLSFAKERVKDSGNKYQLVEKETNHKKMLEKMKLDEQLERTKAEERRERDNLTALRVSFLLYFFSIHLSVYDDILTFVTSICD